MLQSIHELIHDTKFLSDINTSTKYITARHYTTSYKKCLYQHNNVKKKTNSGIKQTKPKQKQNNVNLSLFFQRKARNWFVNIFDKIKED